MTRQRDAVEVPRLPDAWVSTALSDMPLLAAEIVEQIRSEVEDYQHDPSGVIAEGTGHAVREALRIFMHSLARGGQLDIRAVETFRRLGRIEAESGRSHDPLQASYRIASQLVTRRLLDWERKFRAPRDVMAQLSAAVFGFIDQLAALSAQGFAEGRELGDEGRRQRSRILTQLAQDGTTDRAELEDAADRLDWPLPDTCSVVDIELAGVPDDRGLVTVASALFGPLALAGRMNGRSLVLVPGSPSLPELRAAVSTLTPRPLLFVGPHVELHRTPESARLAGLAATALRRAADADSGVVLVYDHLLELLAAEGRDVLPALVRHRLAPLLELSAAKRLKYGELLSAWLEVGTSNAPAPGILDRHRQTLRYQRQQLEQLFGPALDDRTSRLEIMIALRSALPMWSRDASSARPLRRRNDFVPNARTPL